MVLCGKPRFPIRIGQGRSNLESHSVKALLSKLFSGPSPRARAQAALASENDRTRLQMDVACISVRDVLRLHDLPGTWITANPLPCGGPGRPRRIHLQLTVREWFPELLQYMVAIEHRIRIRSLRVDPFAADWLAGISWRFQLTDANQCPSLPRQINPQGVSPRTHQAGEVARSHPAEAAQAENAISAGAMAPRTWPYPAEFAPTHPMGE